MESEFVGSRQDYIVRDGSEDKSDDAKEVVCDEIVEEAEVISYAKTSTKHLHLDCDIIKEEKQSCNITPLHKRATYELEKFKKNILLIFNHKTVEGNKTRYGTEKDVEALRNTFEEFRFNVEVHNDLRKAEVYRELENFSGRDFTEYGCIIVAVLTHGKENLLRATGEDEFYSEVEILRYFDARDNPTLLMKPRVLIVQACRGESNSDGICVPSKKAVQRDDADEGYRYYLPEEADMLILHSSYLGKPSYRHPEEGSWFIQSLCKKVQELAATHDLVSIITEVQNEVAIVKEHTLFNIKTSRLEINKQIPVYQSTLLGKLYLKKFGDAVPTFVLLDDGTRSSDNGLLRGPDPQTPSNAQWPVGINIISALLSLTEWMPATETHLGSAVHDEEDIQRLAAEVNKFERVLHTINLVKSHTCQISEAEASMLTRYRRRFDAIAEQVQMLSEKIYINKSGPAAEPALGLRPPRALSSSSCPNLQHAHRTTSPVVQVQEFGSGEETWPGQVLRRPSGSCPNLQESAPPVSGSARTVPPEPLAPSPPPSRLPPEVKQPSGAQGTPPPKPAVNCLLHKSILRLGKLFSKSKSKPKRPATGRRAEPRGTHTRSAPATFAHTPTPWAELHDLGFASRFSASALDGPLRISLSSSTLSLDMGVEPSLIRELIDSELRDFVHDWE